MFQDYQVKQENAMDNLSLMSGMTGMTNQTNYAHNSAEKKANTAENSPLKKTVPQSIKPPIRKPPIQAPKKGPSKPPVKKFLPQKFKPVPAKLTEQESSKTVDNHQSQELDVAVPVEEDSKDFDFYPSDEKVELGLEINSGINLEPEIDKPNIISDQTDVQDATLQSAVEEELHDQISSQINDGEEGLSTVTVEKQQGQHIAGEMLGGDLQQNDLSQEEEKEKEDEIEEDQVEFNWGDTNFVEANGDIDRDSNQLETQIFEQIEDEHIELDDNPWDQVNPNVEQAMEYQQLENFSDNQEEYEGLDNDWGMSLGQKQVESTLSEVDPWEMGGRQNKKKNIKTKPMIFEGMEMGFGDALNQESKTEYAESQGTYCP